MAAPSTIVGMSGGVDSSVAALLLVRAGEAIAGMFMDNWADDGSGECRADDDRRDAVAVCGRLGIPLHVRDFSREYWDGVFAHFIAEYAAGRTPNPDVLCNREIKFRHFLDAARDLGAERIATGHYARVALGGGRWRLLRALDRDKDQSYFLHLLGQEALAATRFPLGDLRKGVQRGELVEPCLHRVGGALHDAEPVHHPGRAVSAEHRGHTAECAAVLVALRGQLGDARPLLLDVREGVGDRSLGVRRGLLCLLELPHRAVVGLGRDLGLVRRRAQPCIGNRERGLEGRDVAGLLRRHGLGVVDLGLGRHRLVPVGLRRRADTEHGGQRQDGGQNSPGSGAHALRPLLTLALRRRPRPAPARHGARNARPQPSQPQQIEGK